MDDIRPAPKGWLWVKTVPELIDAIEDATWTGKEIGEVSLDNDLGPGEEEGHKYLDYLEEVCEEWLTHLIPKSVSVHSLTVIACVRMQKVINRIYGE